MVGGVSYFDLYSVKTTEFISLENITNAQWHDGPSIKTSENSPDGWSNGGYINIENNRGLVLVSGINEHENYIGGVYLYNENTKKFELLQESLEYPRQDPGVVSIPMGEIDCDSHSTIAPSYSIYDRASLYQNTYSS